jgi:hypothetical protein
MERELDELHGLIEDELVTSIRSLTKEIIELQGIIENLAGTVSYLREMYE